MRRKDATTRDRSRGVAVLEFTLSLVFVIPLLMAALSFGYYFYVGSNAEEAARQGLREASRIGTACAAPGVCAPALAATVTAAATGSGTACVGGAAACYMNSPPLAMGTASNTTVSCTCALAPTNPTFTIRVQVDFPPAVGYYKVLMPSGSGTNIRYTATLTGN